MNRTNNFNISGQLVVFQLLSFTMQKILERGGENIMERPLHRRPERGGPSLSVCLSATRPKLFAVNPLCFFPSFSLSIPSSSSAEVASDLCSAALFLVWRDESVSSRLFSRCVARITARNLSSERVNLRSPSTAHGHARPFRQYFDILLPSARSKRTLTEPGFQFRQC